MRNRIFGAVGVLWGGAMLLRAFLRGGPEGLGAYAAGQTTALAFGALLFLAGAYYLVKGGGAKKPYYSARRHRHRSAQFGVRRKWQNCHSLPSRATVGFARRVRMIRSKVHVRLCVCAAIGGCVSGAPRT